MGQVTIYLDEQTERKMRKAVQESGQSTSKWVAELIREKTQSEWSRKVAGLAGAWGDDFPDLDEIRAGYGPDAPREDF